MGKGIAKRNRKKRFEQANFSNLHKASFGKASATAPLPAAPKDVDLQEKVPASLRRLMALKEAANKEQAKKDSRKQQQQQSQQPSQSQQQHQPHQPQQQQSQQARQQTQPGQKPAGTQQPHNHPSQAAPEDKPQQQPADSSKAAKKQAAAPVIETKIYKEGAFDQTAKKKLKDSKKQFLERKKQRKKGGKTGTADLLTPAELKLKQQALESNAKFGEVADAPLKIQLKRKHWVRGPQEDAAAASQNQPGDSQRMKKIFLQQMATAQRTMSSGGQGGGAAKKRKTSAAPAGGLLQQARERARADAERQAKAALREEVVAAYRNSKKQPSMGAANMRSLAKLVAQGSAAATAAAAIR